MIETNDQPISGETSCTLVVVLVKTGIIQEYRAHEIKGPVRPRGAWPRPGHLQVDQREQET